MDSRALAAGLLGWIIPGLVAIPILLGHESAGGEAALGALIVWLGAGVVGCAVGGAAAAAIGRRSGRLSEAFGSGLAGVAVAGICAIAAEAAITAFVPVLHLGGLSILVPIPFLLAYGVGFGLFAVLLRPGVSGETPRQQADRD